MALHKKWDALCSLAPDIAILPEAASPAILERKGLDLSSVSTIWKGKYGGSENKGLLVACFNDYHLVACEDLEPPLDIFIPLNVIGPICFPLLAVWSFNHRAALSKTPTPDALIRYAGLIEKGAVIAGDFNSNTIWDKGTRRQNFSSIVSHLQHTGHKSIYHVTTGDAFGAEQAATIFWRDRAIDGPRFMIDYVFEPTRWQTARKHFELGRYVDWIASKLSDHVPLICEWDDLELSKIAPPHPLFAVN